MKYNKNEIIISDSEIHERLKNGEWAKPRVRGEQFNGVKYLNIKVLDVDIPVDYQFQSNSKKSKNPTRIGDDAKRVKRLWNDYRRKSNGDCNTLTRICLPVVCKFRDSDILYKVSGHGRIEMFIWKGQKKFPFILYEVTNEQQIEDLMIHFNVSPKGDDASEDELVAHIVKRVVKEPNLDVDGFIEGVYVSTDSRVSGRIKEKVEKSINSGTKPKYYRNIDAGGKRWDEFVDDKAAYPYLHFKEVRKGWIGQTILFTSYRMFRDKWWVMWDNSKRGIRTRFYLDTKIPTGARNLCEMRLKCFNDIYSDWYRMCGIFRNSNMRKPFEVGGFHPTDFYKEHQYKLVSIQKVLESARGYLKLGYTEFKELIDDCEQYIKDFGKNKK